jgi:crotonobetaine/carnitine-CoA ligase
MIDGPSRLGGDVFNRLELSGRTLARLIVDAAERFGDRPFLAIAGGSLRFDDVPTLASRTAGAFRSLGVDRGEAVALLVGNRLEFMATVWGQAWHGAISVPVNPGLRGPSLVHVLNDCGAELLVCDAPFLSNIAEIAGDLIHLQAIVAVGAEGLPDIAGIPVVDWAAIMAAAPMEVMADARFDEPVMIIYTSGTTGLAKGVVMSHHHYYCTATSIVDTLQWDERDHLFTSLPLCHTQAQISFLAAGHAAGAQVTIAERFSASRFMADAAACGATIANLGPTANLVAKQPPSDIGAAALRMVLCNPPPADLRGFEQRFGVSVVWQGYGMTEGYFNPRMLSTDAKPGDCVGKPSSLFEVEIVDDRDVPIPHDAISAGEIVVRPRLPAIMFSQYHRNPQATLDAFRNLWFHTGDLAAMDSDGFMYLKGRKKDSIRRRGENISAAEIESQALIHPLITQAAAFGVPSDLGEDDVKLDVTLVEGAKLDSSELIAFLQQRLAPFMVPRYLQFREVMPMTASEKIEKYRLRAEGIGAVDYDGGDGSRVAKS